MRPHIVDKLSLLAERSLPAAAEAAGVSERTVYSRRADDGFRAWCTPNYHRHKGLAAFRSTWSCVVEDEVMRKLDGGI